MLNWNIRLVGSLLLLSLVVTVGCSQSAPAPAPKPIATKPLISGFSDGVAKLGPLRDEIKAAFDGGNPQECDGAVHTAMEILQVLPSMAMDEGQLDNEAMETVKTSTKQIFDGLMKLHHGFHVDSHEGEKTGYEAVAESMDQAITQLESVTEV